MNPFIFKMKQSKMNIFLLYTTMPAQYILWP